MSILKGTVLACCVSLISVSTHLIAQDKLSGKVKLMISDRELQTLSSDIQSKFAKLRPQSIRPAEGFIKYDYLIPAGFYKQMWDWDGFFIGCHLTSIGMPQYLKWWVLDFVAAMDSEGYIPGCVTTKGPRPVFGKFAMKPFLAQGAYLAARAMNDFDWILPVYGALKSSCAYRERTQYDSAYGLFFWDNAGQSGADNSVVLSNDQNEPSAILGVDIDVFQYREYLALSFIARHLNYPDDADRFTAKAGALRSNIIKYHWDKTRFSFWNIRRRDGRAIRRVSYSNFVPLIQKDLLADDDAKEMIHRYLWNEEYMLAPHGLRSLSKQDPDYNNENIIIPYSNWQGPVWINANYLFFIGLKNFGFGQECRQLAYILGTMLSKDIEKNGSMHENYDGETGEPLAPTAAQSAGGVFTGFVGWNLLAQNMLQGVVDNKWMMLEVP